MAEINLDISHALSREDQRQNRRNPVLPQPSSSYVFLLNSRGEVLKKNECCAQNTENADSVLAARFRSAHASSRRFRRWVARLKAMRGRIALQQRFARNFCATSRGRYPIGPTSPTANRPAQVAVSTVATELCRRTCRTGNSEERLDAARRLQALTSHPPSPRLRRTGRSLLASSRTAAELAAAAASDVYAA